MNSTPTKKSKHNHVSNPSPLDQQIDLNTVPFKLKAPKQPVSETLNDSYCHCHVCFQSNLYHSVHSDEGARKRPFEDKGFDMLTCYGCELTVHRYCYGLKTPINQVKESDGQIVNMFICDRCSSVGPNELKECSVCQQKNGALKKIAKRDAYVHVTCALFSELYYIDDFEKMTVRGCNNSDKRSKSQHVCDYCKKQGNLHTCQASSCQTSSHVYCALKAAVETKQEKPVWSFRLGNAENPVKTLLDYEDPQIKEIMKEIFVRLRRKDHVPETTMAEETENENKNSSAKKKKKGKVAEEEVVAPEHMLSEQEEATVIGISEEVKEKLKSIASGYGQGKTVRGGSVEMQCRQHKMEDLYCICNKPNSSDLPMFACDSCDNWFHHQCFGLSKDQIEKIDNISYTCKKCRLWGFFVHDFFAFEAFKKANPEESEKYGPIKPEYETVGNLEIVPKDVSKFGISDFIIVCIIIQIQLNKQFYNVPEYNIEEDTLPKILLDNAKYIPFNLNGIMSQLLKKPLLAIGTDKIIHETVPLDDYGVIESVYNPETGNFKADKLEKLEESLQVLSSIKAIYEEQGFPQTATLKDIEYRLKKGQWILEVYKALEGSIQELDKVPRRTIQDLMKKAEEIKIDKNQTERKFLESLAVAGGAVEEEKAGGMIEEETHDIIEERLQLIKEKINKLEAIEVQKVSMEEILNALDEIEEICKEALEAKLDMKELEGINKDETKLIKRAEDKIKEGENIQKKIKESCETVVKMPEVFEIIREYKKLKGLQLKAQYYLKNAVNPEVVAARNEGQAKKGGNNAKRGKKENIEEQVQGGLELSEDGGEVANLEEIEELIKECEGIEELKEKGNLKEMIEDIEKIKKEIGECLSKEMLDIQEAEKIYKETKRYKVQFQEKNQLKRRLREYFKRVEDMKNKEYNFDELANLKADFEKKFTKETKFKEEFKNRVDKAKKIQKDAEKFLNKKQFSKDDIEKKSVGFLNEMNEIKVIMPLAMKEDLEGLPKSVQWLEKLYKFRNKCLEKNKDMEEEEHQEGVDVLVKECSDVKEEEWSEIYKKNYEEFKQIMKEGEDIKHKDQRIEKVLKEHASLYCDIEAGLVAEKAGHTSVEDVNKVCEIGQHFHVEKTEGVFDRVTEAQRKYTEWIQAVEEVVGSELIQDVLEEGCNGKEGEVDQLTEKADNLVKGSGHLGVDVEEDTRILKCVWRRLEWSKKGRSLLRMIREGEHVSLEAVEDFIALGQETKVPYNSWLFREIDKELDNLTTMKEQFEEMKKVRKNMKKRLKGVGKEWDQKRKKKELDRMIKKKLKVGKVKVLFEKLKKSSLFLEKVELEEMEAEIKRCEDWNEKVKNYMSKYGGKEIEEATEENWKEIRANVSTENAKEVIKELSDLKNEARDLVLRDETIESELSRFEWIFRATIFTEKAIEKKSGPRSWMKLQKVAESEKREDKRLAETNLYVEIKKELEKYQEFIKKMEDLKAKENALMRKVWNMNDADLWTVERETIKKEELEQLLKDLASEYRVDVKQEAAYIEALLAAGKENINICSQIEGGAYGEKVPADIVKGILGRFKASFVEFKEEEEALLEKIKKADEMRGVLNQFIGGQESAENVIEKYKECPIYFAEAEKIGEEYKKACDTIEKVENLYKKDEKDIKLEEVQGISKRVSRITLNLGEKLDEARKKVWKLKIQAVKRISQQEENNSETTQLQIEELKKYLVEGLKLVKHPEDQADLRDEIQWTEDTVKDVENKLQELKEVNEEEKLQEVNKVINGFVNITREIDEQKRVLEKRRLEKEREEETKKQEELLRKRAFDELIEKATAAAEQEENGGKPVPVQEEEEGKEEISKKLKTETGGYTQQARQKVLKKKQDDEMTRSDLRAELAEALKISKAFKSVKDRYARIAKRIELFIYLGEGARINCHCASIDKICAAIEDLQEDSETAQRIIDGDYDFEYLKKLTLTPVAAEPVEPVKNEVGGGHVVDEESPIEEIQPQIVAGKPQVENIEEEDDEIEEIEEEDEEEDEEDEDEEDDEDEDEEEEEEEIIESGGEEPTRIEQEQAAEVNLPIYEKGSVLKIFEGKIMNTTSLNRSTSLSLGSSSGLKLCSMYTCEDCKTVRTFPKISSELNVAGRGALRDTLEYIEMLGKSYVNNGGANQGNNKPFLVGWIECKRDVQPDMNKLGEELLEKQRVLIIKYMEYADMYILHPAMIKKELSTLLDWYPRVPLGQRKPKGVLLFYIHLRIGRTFRGHFEKIEPINIGMPDPDQSKKEAEEKKTLEIVDIDEGSEPVSPLTSLADGEIDERENMQRMQMNMMNMMGMNVQGGMMNMQQLMAGGMFGAPAGGNMGFNPELMNMWNQNMMQQQQTQMITSSFGGQGKMGGINKGKGGTNMVIDDDEDVIVDEDEEEEDEEEDEEEIEDDEDEDEDEDDDEIIEEVEEKKKSSDKTKPKPQQNVEEIEDEEDVGLEDFEEDEEDDEEDDDEEEKEEKGDKKGATTTIEEEDDDMEIIEMNPGQPKRPPAANRQQQQQQQAFGMMGQGQQDMMALFNSGMDMQSQYNAMFAQLPEQMKMFYMQGMQGAPGGFMNNSGQARKTSKGVIEEINLEDDDEPVVEQKGNNDNKDEGQE